MFSASKTAGPSGYNINNSLRFRDSAGAYLNRTFSTPTNNKIWTWSGWVKRGLDSISNDRMIFSGTTNGTTTYGTIFFNGGGNKIRYIELTSPPGTFQTQLITTAEYRDFSAWYHIVLAVDTTQATASNRVRLYINGVEVTSFSTATYPSQNATSFINSAQQHRLGSYPFGSPNFDGYMAEINFIDGQQLTPSSFGSTNSTTGVWQPAKYTGTYGTNGFYLQFSDIATTSGSNAGLGKDFSGNGNYFNTNNISVTSGTTYDAMTDSPTLTSATTANYATLNPLMAGAPFQTNAAATVSQGNLQADWGTTSQGSLLSTIAMTSGKWYFEGTVTGTNTREVIGIVNSSAATTTYAGGDANGWGYFSVNGNKYNNGSATSYGATYTTNDIIGVAFDADAGSLTFYKNNVSQGTAFTGLASGTYFFAVSDANSSLACGWNVNFGQRPFAYTPPTGFNRLNTFNLPNSTVVKGNTVMDATAYTGTNGSPTTQVISSNFQPDFLWFKKRSASYDHALIDTNRGITKQLYSNLTNAEGTDSDVLTAIGASSFTVGNSNYSNYGTLVAWTWKANGGTTSSNTQGSITSTVQANTTAGFSVVTWSGTGSAATIGHGLGVAPKMVIMKRRNGATNWPVWVTGFSSTSFLFLQSTNAVSTTENYFNSVLPSSTLLNLSGNSEVNGSGGTYVAYCWAEIAGFSKFGSYTGNGSTDGPFIFTGFRPKYVMIKNSSAAYSWYVEDTSRATYNAAGATLAPNTSAAEDTAWGSGQMDILSNGFKIRISSAESNANGNTFIYAAFAENPFKNALAR